MENFQGFFQNKNKLLKLKKNKNFIKRIFMEALGNISKNSSGNSEKNS